MGLFKVSGYIGIMGKETETNIVCWGSWTSQNTHNNDLYAHYFTLSGDCYGYLGGPGVCVGGLRFGV